LTVSNCSSLYPYLYQVLALSATYPEELARLAEKLMRAPQHVRPDQENQVLHGVQQFVLPVEFSPVAAKQSQVKQAALLSLLSSVPYSQCLVFSNYQLVAQSVADFLNSRGFPAIFISGNQEQTRRLQAMQSFKQFNCR
jgi:superfamily II DNA/RNA helicase